MHMPLYVVHVQLVHMHLLLALLNAQAALLEVLPRLMGTQPVRFAPLELTALIEVPCPLIAVLALTVQQ
jgi:hypothetical protein